MRIMRASGRQRFLAALTASLLVAACGGAGSSPSPSPSPAPAASSSTEPSAATSPSSIPSASAAPSANAAACGTYSGPPATITYAIWGDTTELANQQKIVNAFAALDPKIKVKVCLLYTSPSPRTVLDLVCRLLL